MQVVSCVRLLKTFDPKDFQPKISMSGYDSFDSEHLVKHGKRGQITDQFVELPIEHRIYDMVDAEGRKGITIAEVSINLSLQWPIIYFVKFWFSVFVLKLKWLLKLLIFDSLVCLAFQSCTD